MTALIHIGVLIFSAIKNGNIKFLNYFQILGLAEFWPKITRGWISDVISAISMLIIIGIFLTISLNVNRHRKAYSEIGHSDKE